MDGVIASAATFHTVIASEAKQSPRLWSFVEAISGLGEIIMRTQPRQYCVYIMTNKYNTVLYTGVTNDLARRVLEHKSGKGSKFTHKYRVTKLVYFECGDDISAAIAREKQIKAGSRKKKEELISSMNPEWKDLFDESVR